MIEEEEEVASEATTTIEETITGTTATVKNLMLDGDNNKFLSMASPVKRVHKVEVDINLNTLATEVCVEVLVAKGKISNVLKLPTLLLQILSKETQDRIKVVSKKEMANNNKLTNQSIYHLQVRCLLVT